MQISNMIKRSLGRTAAIALAVFALQLVQPVDEVRSDSIFTTGNLLNFSGSPSLSSGRVLSKKPSIALDQNNKALDAYKSGDFSTARKIWEKAAAAGDIFAQWMLARMYRYGQGVDADDGKVWNYYRSVAGKYNGDRNQRTRFHITVDSTYWVAHFRATGIADAGVKKNSRQALKLFRKAASQGHPAAQYEVGRFFLKGLVIRRNNKEGRRWVQTSAMKRHAPAMAKLGTLYWTGDVAQKSRARGLMWYILAKENACPSIHHDIFDRFEEMYIDATDDERSKAKNFAYRWNQRNPLKKGQLIYRLADCG